MLPDQIEKPLYINTLKILLNIVQRTFNNINLDIIGHKFKMQKDISFSNDIVDSDY